MRPVVVAILREHSQLLEHSSRGGGVAARELHLDEQREDCRAIRIRRRRALEAEAAQIPRQGELAARQCDPRERAFGGRVPVEAVQ